MPKADLAIRNAVVLTMLNDRPVVEAVAVTGGRIAAIGTWNDVRPYCDARTDVVDGQGRLVIPGIVDAHMHLLGYAASLIAVDCSPAATPSLSDIKAAIARQVAVTPAGTWIRARGYDESALAGRHPTRQDLDAVSPAHPVRLVHRSGHALVLNSLAMRLAGITNETDEPEGALIDRDLTTGEPSGLLLEMAEWVDRVAPPIGETDLTQALATASARLLSEGVTSIQDATHTNSWSEVDVIGRMVQNGVVRQRVRLMEGYQSFAVRRSNRENVAFDALMFDASGSSTVDDGEADDVRRAFKHAPVKIMLHELGDDVWPRQRELETRVESVHRSGRQVAIHAVGIRAVESALNAIERALDGWPRAGHRHRIEHCSICPLELAQRLADSEILVVTQPSFLSYSGDRYLKEVPDTEIEDLYPLWRLLDAGVRVASGSDAPVVPPKLGPRLLGAVTRQAANGAVVNAAQRVSLVTSVRMATADAAFAARMEHQVGVIAPGYAADLLLLSANSLDAEDLLNGDVRVALVVLRGKPVVVDDLAV